MNIKRARCVAASAAGAVFMETLAREIAAEGGLPREVPLDGIERVESLFIGRGGGACRVRIQIELTTDPGAVAETVCLMTRAGAFGQAGALPS